jgi:hypothetical protein
MRRDFARALRAATALSGAPPARNQVFDQWAYERLGVPGGLGELSGNPNPPEALQQALAATTEAEVASGEALNHILTAIVAAEPKTGKAPPSAFLPPNLMSEVRFGGSPAGEALNLLRSAGKLEFPAAFDVPALRDTRDVIDRDFAAAAAPVLAGKPADPLKTAKLAATVQAAKQRLTPVLRDQPFHEAAYARRFISQLEAAVKALREAGSSALVNPKWGTEGTNVADLVRHMTKHKLLFGPVEKGKEDAYLALHRALATYLFALTQAQQAKK